MRAGRAKRRRGIALAAATLLIACQAIGVCFGFQESVQASTAAAGAEPVLIGEFKREMEGLREPVQIAISSAGHLLVAESAASTVAIVDARGEIVRRIGGATELLKPAGIAEAADGRVVVSDAGAHQVVVFDTAGKVVARWGKRGAGPGEFNEPAGIAIHSDAVFVVDRGNHRVQRFSLDGRSQQIIGGPGSGPGLFHLPADVAVDAAGNLYVADAGNNRVQKFDADLKFVAAWGEWGPFPGLFDDPSGIEARGGQVYVVDRRNHRVQVLTDGGELIEEWGVHEMTPHEGGGRLHYPNDMAIMADGTVIIAEAIEDRCQVFAARPRGAPPPPRQIYERQQQTHFGEYLSIDGKLMTIAEPENHFVFVFDISYEEPVIINTFGERGEQFGLLLRAAGISLDIDDSTILVADADAQRIQQFRMSYDPKAPLKFIPNLTRFAQAWDLGALRQRMPEPRPTWPIEPAAIRRDAQGNLYIVDPRNASVHVFDSSMSFVRTIGDYGRDPGQFLQPTDLAFSRDESIIFIVDALAQRVSVFSADGSFKESWDEGLELQRPFGVAAVDDFIYVTDPAADRVVKIDRSGRRVATFGSRGGKVDQLWKPRGIAHDPALNHLFISDSGNHRTKVFSPDGEWLVTFGAGGAYTRSRRPAED
jgi:DNA-binding beta-propeller fold protein YncE